MATLLKPAEVAKRLDISKRKVYYLIAQGELPSQRHLVTGAVRVTLSDLNDYIRTRKAANA